MKKWLYIIGILALGFVVFNKTVQTGEVIKLNPDYLIGLIILMIAIMIYGIAKLKN